MESRVVRLEEQVKHHDHRIAKVEKKTTSIHEDLVAIKEIMAKIKNWIIGGVVVFIVQQVGLVDFLKLILGIPV